MEQIPIISIKQMRASDAATIEKLGDSKILMYAAGEAVVHQVDWESLLVANSPVLQNTDITRNVKAPSTKSGQKAADEQVAILCGSGNNAGDGYVIAGILYQMGISVKLYLLFDKFSDDGRYYYEQCVKMGIPHEKIQEGNVFSTRFTKAKVIVDCIYGTGFRGKLDQRVKQIIQSMNESNAYIISVDINSGMNGDTGVEEICVISDLTVSIGFYKYAHAMQDCKKYMKKLVNANIGIELAE